jgi:hypothetical protein
VAPAISTLRSSRARAVPEQALLEAQKVRPCSFVLCVVFIVVGVRAFAGGANAGGNRCSHHKRSSLDVLADQVLRPLATSPNRILDRAVSPRLARCQFACELTAVFIRSSATTSESTVSLPWFRSLRFLPSRCPLLPCSSLFAGDAQQRPYMYLFCITAVMVFLAWVRQSPLPSFVCSCLLTSSAPGSVFAAAVLAVPDQMVSSECASLVGHPQR